MDEKFFWILRLGCPPTACTDNVKKILSKGVLELLWDDLATATFTAQEVIEIRKNILLHKLKYKMKDNKIECTKGILQLKSKEDKLNMLTSALEAEYEKQDFSVRRKVQRIEEIKSEHSTVTVKKSLLQEKYKQTETLLRDCAEMRLICQHLMPNTCKDLNPQNVKEALEIVMGLYSGANKKLVYSKVSNLLGHIDVPTLWNQLYENLLQSVNKLTTLCTVQVLEKCRVGEHMETGIAKILAQHICMFSKHLLWNSRINMHNESAMDFIQKIEMKVESGVDISEWLTLVLEVHKLEMQKKVLEDEIEQISNNVNHEVITFNLTQVKTDIQNIDLEIERYIRNIQELLSNLKSAEFLLCKINEEVQSMLQKIASIRAANHNSEYFNDDLNTELNVYYDVLDINAVRKIVIIDEVENYKYVKCCLNKASISMTNSQCCMLTSRYPMIHVPLYYLMDCFKNLMLYHLHKKNDFQCLQEQEFLQEDESSHSLEEKKCDDTLLDLFSLARVTCIGTRDDIHQFNSLLNAWSNQTVQEVMAIQEKTLDDATFSEWLQRYTLLIYMIKNPK